MNLNDFIPLVGFDDKWNISDEDLADLYHGLVKDGTAELVFFDGSINSPELFIEAIKSPANLSVVFFRKGRPAGFAWINALTSHTGSAHFALRRFAWGEWGRMVGKATLNYWMDFNVEGEPILQVILGILPAKNRRAVRFVADLGFKSSGQIPKMLMGRDGNFHTAQMMYYERAQICHQQQQA